MTTLRSTTTVELTKQAIADTEEALKQLKRSVDPQNDSRFDMLAASAQGWLTMAKTTLEGAMKEYIRVTS